MNDIHVPARRAGSASVAVFVAVGVLRLLLNTGAILACGFSSARVVAAAVLVAFVLPYVECVVLGPILRRVGLVRDDGAGT